MVEIPILKVSACLATLRVVNSGEARQPGKVTRLARLGSKPSGPKNHTWRRMGSQLDPVVSSQPNPHEK